MRPISFFLAGIALFLFTACHQHPQNTSSGKPPGISDSLAAQVMGTYSGSFNKSMITLVINYISGKTVSGYDIHKGLRRNVNGEVAQEGNHLRFVLKEPGDNPYDGTFIFSLDTATLKIAGKWVPLDDTKVPARQLALARSAEESGHYANEWLGLSSRDSTLSFSDNGVCLLTFYERPQDSTSQMITVRGNYKKEADSIFIIEWQKSKYMEVPVMKLIESQGREGNDSVEYIPPTLQGSGLKFRKNNAG